LGQALEKAKSEGLEDDCVWRASETVKSLHATREGLRQAVEHGIGTISILQDALEAAAKAGLRDEVVDAATERLDSCSGPRLL
jgi:hypothetical protein